MKTMIASALIMIATIFVTNTASASEYVRLADNAIARIDDLGKSVHVMFKGSASYAKHADKAVKAVNVGSKTTPIGWIVTGALVTWEQGKDLYTCKANLDCFKAEKVREYEAVKETYNKIVNYDYASVNYTFWN